jgi:tRNA pseudouridine38-40 synthase
VRLRIDLAYDGAPYHGLARQPGLPTVQGTVEEALGVLLGAPVRSTASGRTDRGVHGRGQVLHADVPSALSARDVAALLEGLRASLPESIVVLALRPVPTTFDARFSATGRVYRYRLRDGIDPREHAAGSPPEEPDVWGVIASLDVAAMRRSSRPLLGEHDFTTFCRNAPGRTPVRRLDVLSVRRIGPAPGRIDVRLRGRAFCHQQVRSIVGCLVDVGRGRHPEAWLGRILVARDRALAAPVAPAHGLTFEEVHFGRGIPAAPPPGTPLRAPVSRPPDAG